MPFSLGGIEFNAEGDASSLIKALTDVSKALDAVNASLGGATKGLKEQEQQQERSAAKWLKLAGAATSVATAMQGAAAATIKWALILGGVALAAMTAVEVVVGRVATVIGERLVESFQESVAAGIQLERLQFGLTSAVEAYTRVTNDATLSATQLKKASVDLAVTMGIARDDVQQAYLIMLDMARATGLSGEQISGLIARAAEFSVVAKQDFLQVIIGIDQALRGYPQILRGMGLALDASTIAAHSAGEAISGFRGGVATAAEATAAYTAFLEQTAFAHGKVAESFNTTVFGAINKSQAAWQVLTAEIAEHAREIEGPFIKSYHNAKTAIAEAVRPHAEMLATTTAVTGAVLSLVGPLIQLSSVYVALRFAMESVRVLSTTQIPLLSSLVSGFIALRGVLEKVLVAHGLLAAGTTLTSLAALRVALMGIVTLIGKFFMEAVRGAGGVLLWMATTAIARWIAATVVVTGVVFKLYDTLTKQNAAIVAQTEALDKHVTHVKKLRDNYNELAGIATKNAEQTKRFHSVVEEINRIYPNLIDLKKQDKQAIADINAVLSTNIALNESLLRTKKEQAQDALVNLIVKQTNQETAMNEIIERRKRRTSELVNLESERLLLTNKLTEQAGRLSTLDELITKNSLRSLDKRIERTREALAVDAKLENEATKRYEEITKQVEDLTALVYGIPKPVAEVDKVFKSLGERLAEFNHELASAQQSTAEKRAAVQMTMELIKAEGMHSTQMLKGHGELERDILLRREKNELIEIELHGIEDEMYWRTRIFEAQKKQLEHDLEARKQKGHEDVTAQAELREQLQTLTTQHDMFMRQSKERIKQLHATHELERKLEDEAAKERLIQARREVSELAEQIKRDKLAAFEDESAVLAHAQRVHEANIDRIKTEAEEERKTKRSEVEVTAVAIKEHTLLESEQVRHDRTMLDLMKSFTDKRLTLLLTNMRIMSEAEDAQRKREIDKRRMDVEQALSFFQKPLRGDFGQRGSIFDFTKETSAEQDRVMKRVINDLVYIDHLERERVRKRRDTLKEQLTAYQDALAAEVKAKEEQDKKLRQLDASIVPEHENDRMRALKERIHETEVAVSEITTTYERLSTPFTMVQQEIAHITDTIGSAVDNLKSHIKVITTELEDTTLDAPQRDEKLREYVALMERLNDLLVLQAKSLTEVKTADTTTKRLTDIQRELHTTEKAARDLDEVLKDPGLSPEDRAGALRAYSDAITRLQELLQEQGGLHAALKQVEKALVDSRQAAASLGIELKNAAAAPDIAAVTEKLKDAQAEVTKTGLQYQHSLRVSSEDVARAEIKVIEQRIAMNKIAVQSDADRVRNEAVLYEELAAKKAQIDDGFFQQYFIGLKQYVDATQVAYNLAFDLARTTANGMYQAFYTFFFKAMNREIRGMKDLFRSFGELAKHIIAQVIAQLITLAAAKAAVGLASAFFGVPAGGSVAGGAVATLVSGLIKGHSVSSSKEDVEVVHELQHGGIIEGSNLPGDHNLIAAETGEFMIRRAAVERYGRGLFERLNSLSFSTPQAASAAPAASPVIIMNVADPTMVPRYLFNNPNVIHNIVGSDIKNHGVTRRELKRRL